MKRVIGLGGIFFKAKDKKATIEWYKKHLGLNINENYGGTEFHWRDAEKPDQDGYSVWSVMPDTTKYFDPSESKFMMNFIVDDLEKLFPVLKEEGVTLVGDLVVGEYGKFAWALDPDGNKIELWEPPVK